MITNHPYQNDTTQDTLVLQHRLKYAAEDQRITYLLDTTAGARFKSKTDRGRLRPGGVVLMSVIRDSAGFTFTPFIWCGRQLGWTIWTPAGSCLRVVYDNNLEEAQR